MDELTPTMSDVLQSEKKKFCAVFQLISSGAGPRTCSHVGLTSGYRLFIHGGKSSADPSAKDVKNDFWIFQVDENRWENLTNDLSPYLSQHCGFVSDGGAFPRLFLIGGWNGRNRTSDVYSFRLDTRAWEKWSTSGFPVGAGLSSFAVVPLVTVGSVKSSSSMIRSSNSVEKQRRSSSEDEEILLVCGREGGLRTQRRAGNAYLLRCNNVKNQSVYEPFPKGTASRSGHTATALPEASQVVLIGGRDGAFVETIDGVKPRTIRGSDSDDGLEEYLREIKHIKPMAKDPPSRQRHVAIPVGNCAILIHGGETFNGKAKTAVADLFLVWFEASSTAKSPRLAKWLKLDAGDSSPHLAGHSAALIGPKDILLFGGYETKAAFDHCYKLTLT